MITDALLNILDGLLSWLSSVRPTWDVHLPSGVSTFVSTMKAYDAYLPISEGLTIVGLVVTLVTAMQVWKWSIKLIDWIADVIP